MINLTAAVLSIAVSIAMAILGYDWLTLGHGLNPYISFPWSAVAAAIAVWMFHRAIQDYNQAHEYETWKLNRDLKHLRHITHAASK